VKALVVRGGWDGHEPVATSDLFAGFLRTRGFSVSVSDTLDVYEDPAAMSGADLIVQCWTGGRLTAGQETGLVERVRAGAGFAGWHGGIVATGYEAPRYQFMVGGRFICHPGDFVDYDVTITGNHPVVADVKSYSVHTEQYFCHVDPTLTVHATTTFTGAHDAPETAGAQMPVVWTRQFGKGRVFVSTLGHNTKDLATPQTRKVIEQGLLWAAESP
jgi:type 1 glutamine amidotransferase